MKDEVETAQDGWMVGWLDGVDCRGYGVMCGVFVPWHGLV